MYPSKLGVQTMQINILFICSARERMLTLNGQIMCPGVWLAMQAN